MVVDGTDPFGVAKPDARLIRLLLRARRFNATLAQGEGAPFAALAQREGVSRSYFTRLVRLSYLAPDITQAILDGRQPSDLTAEKLLEHSAACLARSADRARLCVTRSKLKSPPALTRQSLGATTSMAPGYWNMAPQRYYPRLVGYWRALRVSADRVTSSVARTRAECRDSRPSKADSYERLTLCWREMDSNHRYPAKIFWRPRRSPQFIAAILTGSLATGTDGSNTSPPSGESSANLRELASTCGYRCAKLPHDVARLQGAQPSLNRRFILDDASAPRGAGIAAFLRVRSEAESVDSTIPGIGIRGGRRPWKRASSAR
jgi:hypothetical protein